VRSIALCSQIWDAIFPQLSLDTAASRAALEGVDVAVAEVLSLHADAQRSTVSDYAVSGDCLHTLMYFRFRLSL
jgi:hypothetical protein